jgi:hypothetical protein
MNIISIGTLDAQPLGVDASILVLVVFHVRPAFLAGVAFGAQVMFVFLLNEAHGVLNLAERAARGRLFELAFFLRGFFVEFFIGSKARLDEGLLESSGHNKKILSIFV